MIQLRDYQHKLIDECRRVYRSGKRRPCLQLGTGGGKTVIFSFISKSAVELGSRVMVIAHRSEILAQISRTLSTVGVDHGMIQSGCRMDPSKKVHVASVQTLVNRFDDLPAPDFIVLDECFPAGTLVDGRPIESIKQGDLVTGWDADRSRKTIEKVRHTMKRRPSSMVSVTMGDGRRIDCTPEHPFLTCFGWVPAWRLTNRDMVLSIMSNELLHLRKSKSEEAVRKSVVQVETFSHDNSENFQEAWRGDNPFQENERNARSGYAGKGVNKAEGYGVEAEGSWRERETVTCSAGSDGVGARMENRGCSANKNAEALRISNLLQAGRGEFGAEDRSGSGWEFPLCYSKETARREEGQVSGWIRVESVEVLEQTSDGTFGGVCPGGFVYNFETSKTHTYTANGIVVHNCHHAAAKTWVKVFARYHNARFLGVTATPERCDGKGLDEFFDHLITGPSVAWLIENKFLAKPRYFAPQITPDFEHVTKVAGDYSKSEIAVIVDKPSIIGDSVDHYRRILHPRTAVAFCVNLVHAENVSASFRAFGIHSEIIDGKMSDSDRLDKVQRLASGEIRVLVSVDLISEGFDLPSVNGAILLRPTHSLALSMQQIGRALRAKKDGSEAIILDHVGNLARHGLAEEDRIWSLEGNASKRRTKEAILETRQCQKCWAVYQGTVCPECGVERKSKAREIEEREGELREIAAKEMEEKRNARIEVANAKTYPELMAIAKKRGYHYKWAWKRWQVSRHNPTNRRKTEIQIV